MNLILKGSTVRLISLFVGMGFAFFLMPFVIGSLGDRWFGVWVIVGSVMGYYGLLDFGLSNATQRYITKALSLNDFDGVNKALSTAFYIFLGLSVAALAITGSIALCSPLFFDDPAEQTTFATVIMIMGINVAVCFPMYAFLGVLNAKMRFDIASYINIFKVVVRSGAILYFLSQGGDIVDLAIISAIAEISGYLLITLNAYRILPAIKIRRKSFDRKELSKLVNFSKYGFIISVADRFRFSIDELVIAAVLTLSLVTHYAIAARLIGYIGQALTAIFGVLAPVLTTDYATKNWPALRKKFLFTTKICCLISSIAAGGSIVFGDELITLWVGEEYLDAFLPLVILTVSSLIANSQRPSVAILFATARHKHYAIATSIEAAANLALSIVLSYHYGIIGIALGTAIPMLVVKVFFQPWYTCRILEVKLSSYVKALLPIYCYATATTAAFYAATEYYPITNFLELLLWGGGYSAITFVFYIKFIIDKESAEFLSARLPAAIVKLRLVRSSN